MKRLAILAAALTVGAAAPEAAPPPGIDKLPAIGATADARDNGAAFQALAMVGREDRIVAANADRRTRCVTSTDDPIATIAAAAQNTRVVIINEAYDAPRDRAFVADLAEALYTLGYHTYAAETFLNLDEPGQRDVTRLNAGVYSDEPAYGALLRRAKALGYRFLPYEATVRDTGATIRAMGVREEQQAANLAAYIRRNPDEKVLVHVGYSHNRETTERLEGLGRIRWMAARLTDMTEINPLTIDQTMFIADATGICTAGDNAAPLPPDRDIYIAQPLLTFQRSRPAWRLAEGQRFADVPRALRDADARVIVEARLTDDPADSTPADRILIDPGENIPLLLAPGRYKARAWIDDEWTDDAMVTVREITAQPVVARQKTTQKTSRRKTR